MGLMQRNKGKRFERQLATIMRSHFPDAIVRRASQADRAHQSDVYVTGGPPLLSRLWLEAQDAAAPTPIAKLLQAERDVGDRSHLLPVVVWHKLRQQTIHATLRLGTLDAIRCFTTARRDSVVTLELRDLLGLIAEYAEEHASMEAT